MTSVHVLVTGAGGFNGRRLVRALLGSGYEVTALVGRHRRTMGGDWPKSGGLRQLWGDLAGEVDLPPRIDAVIHAAARSWVPGVTTEAMVRDNALATGRLAIHARDAGARKFINFSSLSVNGRIRGPEVDETTPIIDPDVYGMTKFLGERLVAEQVSAFPSLSIRLPGVLGPDSTRNWLTRMVETARNGGQFRYFNPDSQFNNAVHVDDLAAFVVALLRRDWRDADVVTLGAAAAIPLRRVVEIVYGAFGDLDSVEIVPPTKPAFTIASGKAVAHYGYIPAETTGILARFVEERRAQSISKPQSGEM